MRNVIYKKLIAVMLITLCVMGTLACSSTSEKSTKASQNETQNSAKDVTKESDETHKKNSAIDISKARFVTDGKLTVGMVVDYLPFEYYPCEGASPIGIDVDIVNALSKQFGVEVEIKDVPWDNNLFTNLGSEYDVVCSAVTVTQERLEDMIFSNSYMDNYQSIIIRKDSNFNIDSFEALDGLKVAVQKETVSSELIHEYIDDKKIDVKLIENDKSSDCFEQLINGEVEVVICDSTVTEGEVARNSDTLKEAYRDKNNVEHLAIAIAKDNGALKDVVDEALANLTNDGTIQKIIKSWHGR